MKKIEWFDVKTCVKKYLRSVLYLYPVQQLICFIVMGYMWLVYLTSRKKFVGVEHASKVVKNGGSVILASWHNRLMLSAFTGRYIVKKVNKNYRFVTLASNHGDGRFVGEVMKRFGFENISGSSNDGRKSSRGIALSAMRKLVRSLKSGRGLGITPDGPRGPNQKINGEIIGLAKMSGAKIIPTSFSSSRFKTLNSWDKFRMPLPFSKINFYFGEVFELPQKIEDEESLRLDLEKVLNEIQEKSAKF